MILIWTHICCSLKPVKETLICKVWLELSSALTHGSTLSSPLSSLHRLLFHCVLFLPLPVRALCVHGTVLCFVVSPLQTVLRLTGALLPLSVSTGLLFVSLNQCHLLYLHLIYTLSLSLSLSLCTYSLLSLPLLSSSFPPLSSTFFHSSFPSLFSVFSSFFVRVQFSLLLSFSVLSRQTTHGEVNAVPPLCYLQLILCNILLLFISSYRALNHCLWWGWVLIWFLTRS